MLLPPRRLAGVLVQSYPLLRYSGTVIALMGFQPQGLKGTILTVNLDTRNSFCELFFVNICQLYNYRYHYVLSDGKSQSAICDAMVHGCCIMW